jgi:hypothetical protein
MKRLLLTLSIVLVLFSCNNGGMNNEEETGPFSLIGTWEAEGEYRDSLNMEYIYNSELTFNETQFLIKTTVKSKDNSISFDDPRYGTYTHKDDYLECLMAFSEIKDNPTFWDWKLTYNFINANNLSISVGISDIVKDMVYKSINSNNIAPLFYAHGTIFR